MRFYFRSREIYREIRDRTFELLKPYLRRKSGTTWKCTLCPFYALKGWTRGRRKYLTRRGALNHFSALHPEVFREARKRAVVEAVRRHKYISLYPFSRLDREIAEEVAREHGDIGMATMRVRGKRIPYLYHSSLFDEE